MLYFMKRAKDHRINVTGITEHSEITPDINNKNKGLERRLGGEGCLLLFHKTEFGSQHPCTNSSPRLVFPCNLAPGESYMLFLSLRMCVCTHTKYNNKTKQTKQKNKNPERSFSKSYSDFQKFRNKNRGLPDGSTASKPYPEFHLEPI